MLTFSTIVVQTLNKALVVGNSRTTTRKRPKLVGYIVWNSSLNGGKAIQLLAFFSLLKLISISRLSPYRSIMEILYENIHVFAGVDGIRDATRRMFHRLRAES